MALLPNDIVITGLGPISSIGCGREPYWESLLAGRSGIGPITTCDVSDLPTRIGAEIVDFHLEDFVERGRVLGRGLPRMSQLSMAASALALRDAGLDDPSDRDRVGVYVGTSIANLDTLLTMHARYEAGETVPAYHVFHAFNHSAACLVASQLDLRGPVLTVSVGCNSGLDALGQASFALRAGTADAMLVVGCDCELVREIVQAMCLTDSVSTKYNDDPTRASRPFEAGRDGNVLGEGAGALIVERAGDAQRRGAHIYARLAGYANAGAGKGRGYRHDSPDLDPEPCSRTLSAALTNAGWKPDDVDVVSANGSSSVRYDPMEAAALGMVFGARGAAAPITHSVKSMLGQHGAGTSALQAIAACLTVSEGMVPPTINFDQPGEGCEDLRILSTATAVDHPRVLAHAIGMGGFYYSAAAFESVS